MVVLELQHQLGAVCLEQGLERPQSESLELSKEDRFGERAAQGSDY